MFEIGWSELLVIAVVAIVVIGPKDLPRVMRMVGQWTGKMKRMASEFQGQFNEALREAELENVRKDVEALGKMDPLADVRAGLTKASEDIKKGLDVTKPAAVPAPTETTVPAAEPVEAAPATPAEPAAAGEVKS